MNKQRIVLIGGGGHCRSVIEGIESTNLYDIIGVVEKEASAELQDLGYPNLGTDEVLPSLIRKTDLFLITIGQIESSEPRIRLFSLIKSLGGKMAVVLANSAQVSSSSSSAEGTVIMHNALVNANATIGANCIINTAAIIEHDVVIGDHTHISTGAIVNGSCIVGDESFVGSNAVVSNNITIGNRCIIGAGSVVIEDVQDGQRVAGNPARSIKM